MAVDLGERAINSALAAAGVAPHEVDTIVMVPSAGIAVPTIDARLMTRIGLRPDVKRVPLFGLGCVAGAAGMARVHDYLHGYPQHVAVLLSVELCSLTMQRDDTSVPALIGVSLFGDGAGAVVATGAERFPLADSKTGPRVLATRSRVIPETVDVMGWNVGSSGFQLVMSRDVPKMADDYLRAEVDAFLADHGLAIADIEAWVCHPGGPKVLESIENAVGLPAEALAHSRDSMRENGKRVLGVRAGRAAPHDRGAAGRRRLRGDARDGARFQLRAAIAAVVTGDDAMYYYRFILAVGAERLVELAVAQRNARWSMAHGGKEFGRDHYPAMVSMHALLLVSCIVETWSLGRPFIGWLG